ncbi:MAG: hypothetical protein II992_09785 [Lachnospiraceae bacterium]|nr:hypothetical protein [Lachnospiraceae bacterium]
MNRIISRRIGGFTLFALLLVGGYGCSKEGANEKGNDSKVAKSLEIVDKDLPEESYGTIANGVYTATGGALQITVPNDWTVSEEDATVLVAGNEKDIKDCVSVQYAEKYENFKNYKQADFEEHYNSIFDNFTMDKFEYTKIADLDAIYMEYSFSKDDSDVKVYYYMIDGDYSYMISFNDISGELKDEISACMDSIELCK